MTPVDINIEEPREGGSYVRNEDGTLTLAERTQPAGMRDKRQAEATNTPPSESVDPGAAVSAAPESGAGA